MGKFDLCEQDKEDYEQELLIKQWMDQSGHSDRIDLIHISNNGNPRNTLVRASFSLDQKITDDSTGTFADLIEGNSSGGSSLGNFFGDDSSWFTDASGSDDGRSAEEVLEGYFKCLGFKGRECKWLIEKLKSWEKMKRMRSQKYQIDSEWWEPLTSFAE